MVAGCGSKEETGVVGTVRGFTGGAVADEPRAARVAADMLSAGGTAADAAVALYFTLSVTLPSVASLGGGGVCVVYDGKANRGQILDFMPRQPAGGGPIAVPVAARGMFALYAQYGKLRWEQLIGPAETLARFGGPVSRALAADLLAAAPDLQLELVDSATVPGAAEGEQLVFLHYVGHGTGPDGPFEIRGLDRVRTRDGMVVENVIRYEPVVVT